ncbi:MAG: glycosyltransferase family 2 protein [Fuerstiella sp.]|nr:glycosyltransferase family 2 protein [Fuerstiella sp.]MCP4858545.1 glycosyltransferase family 2 protein [Fuerstiella sp.]
MKLSIVIPAYNEEQNIGLCLAELRKVVRDEHQIPYEIIVVNDNSSDGTEVVVRDQMKLDTDICIVNRTTLGGFGRAIRSGLEAVTGEVVVICMADLSDDPQDVVAYYRKINEGYDCVFGSRFIRGSKVEKYPVAKLFVNRIVNTCIRVLFRTRFNDLTNAFKAYRTKVLRDCGPFRSSHFNITLELSLSALIRNYNIAQIPISWCGRTWGASNLRIGEMGRRYLCTVLMFYFQRMLIRDDVVAEQLANQYHWQGHNDDIEDRLSRLESVLAAVHEEFAVPINKHQPTPVASPLPSNTDSQAITASPRQPTPAV